MKNNFFYLFLIFFIFFEILGKRRYQSHKILTNKNDNISNKTDNKTNVRRFIPPIKYLVAEKEKNELSIFQKAALNNETVKKQEKNIVEESFDFVENFGLALRFLREEFQEIFIEEICNYTIAVNKKIAELKSSAINKEAIDYSKIDINLGDYLESKEFEHYFSSVGKFIGGEKSIAGELIKKNFFDFFKTNEIKQYFLISEKNIEIKNLSDNICYFRFEKSINNTTLKNLTIDNFWVNNNFFKDVYCAFFLEKILADQGKSTDFYKIVVDFLKKISNEKIFYINDPKLEENQFDFIKNLIKQGSAIFNSIFYENGKNKIFDIPFDFFKSKKKGFLRKFSEVAFTGAAIAGAAYFTYKNVSDLMNFSGTKNFLKDFSLKNLRFKDMMGLIVTSRLPVLGVLEKGADNISDKIGFGKANVNFDSKISMIGNFIYKSSTSFFLENVILPKTTKLINKLSGNRFSFLEKYKTYQNMIFDPIINSFKKKFKFKIFLENPINKTVNIKIATYPIVFYKYSNFLKSKKDIEGGSERKLNMIKLTKDNVFNIFNNFYEGTISKKLAILQAGFGLLPMVGGMLGFNRNTTGFAGNLIQTVVLNS